jgi:hypothetical protein
MTKKQRIKTVKPLCKLDLTLDDPFAARRAKVEAFYGHPPTGKCEICHKDRGVLSTPDADTFFCSRCCPVCND